MIYNNKMKNLTIKGYDHYSDLDLNEFMMTPHVLIN